MNKYIIVLCCILFSSITNAEGNSCKVEGYTIGFFNGVMTSRTEAIRGQRKLASTIGYWQYNGEEVNYQLFYNNSGKDDELGYGLLEDFAETFDQRTQELGQQTFDKWEGFWEIVNNRQNGSIIQKISSIISGFFDFVVSSVNTTINLAIRDFLEFIASNPNTGEVSRHHQLIGDSLAWQGKKILLIAHSQGNLWMNEAYQSILEKKGYDKSSVKAVYIAPASPIIDGDYIFSDNDIVIKGLSWTNMGSQYGPNVSAKFTKDDILGHGLIEVYLHDNTTKRLITSAVQKAMVSLAKPEMEDYLFNITYNFSPNFVKDHYSPEFNIVDSSDLQNAEYFKSEGRDSNYLKKDTFCKASLNTQKHDLEIEQSSKLQENYSFSFNTCKNIEHRSYLWAHLSNSHLCGDIGMSNYYFSVKDRYGEKVFGNENFLNFSGYDYFLDVYAEADFLELITSTDNYTEADKLYLKAQHLPISYTLQADSITSTSMQH